MKGKPKCTECFRQASQISSVSNITADDFIFGHISVDPIMKEVCIGVSINQFPFYRTFLKRPVYVYKNESFRSNYLLLYFSENLY